MPTQKLTITLEKNTVDDIDKLVKVNKYKSRSKAIQRAIEEYLKLIEKQKLYAEIDKLDEAEEMKVAEESMEAVNEIWDEY
jgi:metal-responsive CopG/Arc/MetJ family transcriptional regulator